MAALFSAALVSIEILAFTLWPQPETVAGYFALLQSNRLIGLIDLYLLEFFAYVLFVPMFLAIYVALRRVNESYIVLATIFAIVGIVVFLATNNPFSMLSLSNQYAVATTDAQRIQYLAAGYAILANTNQRAVGGFNMGFFLVSIAGLIISSVMLQSKAFSKVTAYMGFLTFTLSIADYFRIILIPSEQVLLVTIAITSGLTILIWLVLITKNLLHLEKSLD